jgi:YHS domain-containing protein
MAIDPVCQMTFDESAAAAASEDDGVPHSFCVSGCRVAPDEDPEEYLRTPRERSLLSRLIPGRGPRLGR